MSTGNGGIVVGVDGSRLAQKAQLLILGSHGDRLIDRLHRSVRSAVVAASAIPVIIAGHTRRV